MSDNSTNEFLKELKIALESKNTEKIDGLLEYTSSGDMSQNEVDSMSEIISETTLYLEFQEEDYREMALVLIREREE